MRKNLLIVFLLTVFIKLTMVPPKATDSNEVTNSNTVNSNGPKIVNSEVFVNPDTIMFMREMSFPDSDEVYTDLAIVGGKNMMVTETRDQILRKIKRANKRK